MTGRIKWEETGNKITLLPAEWKECRCVSTGIFETDAKLIRAKISFTRKITLHGAVEHLPYRNAVLEEPKFWNGRIM